MLIIICQFFLCLSILIVLHEAGHFFTAKMFKIKVEKFYLFFNPWFSVFKKKFGETTYGIGWLPLGGYVKIAGMIDESMDKDQLKGPAKSWEFRSKPRWQRLIVMLGGVVVNFILAFVIYIFMFSYWGERVQKQRACSVYSNQIDVNDFPLKSGDKILSINNKSVEGMCWRDVKMDLFLWGEKKVVVSRDGENKTISLFQKDINLIINEAVVFDDISFKIASIVDGPAKNAKFKKGDVLTKINGKSFSGLAEFRAFFEDTTNTNKTVLVEYQRDGIVKSADLTIPGKSKSGKVLIGVDIELPSDSIIKRGVFQSFPAALYKTKKEIMNYIGQFGLLFKMDDGVKKLGGFITIGSLFGTKNEKGEVYWNWEHFWRLTAFISIMLAVVNLLPIPALDGGHVLILLIEMVTRRDIDPKILGYIQVVGMILLLGLFILANVNDVMKLF